MNPQPDRLPAALRELAANSPQASPELGASLGREFARHHARRRLRNRAVVAGGLAACLAMSVALLRKEKPTAAGKVADHAAETAKVPAPPAPSVVAPDSSKAPVEKLAEKVAEKPRTHTLHAKEVHRRSAEAPPVTYEAGDFVALPTFDPAIPLGDSRMVRVDMPGSALQQIGYPVDGQLLDRRILTDVLVGQDGMPYAVRLVQTRDVR